MNDKPTIVTEQPRIHLLCNAHLDPVWLWEWEEGAAAALSTFRTAADLCEAFDGFVFNHNEALLYEWVETYEPALFVRIQRLVREGRWHIMGGWYLQPDCNMPSGESFVRQILVGRRYFQQKFGARPTTAINFDPFGHSRGLVQILTKSGYDSYLFCRPSEEWRSLPDSDFVWVGFDGSEVIGHRTMTWYNSSLGRARDKVERWMQEHPDRDLSLVLWGVGDHGGGPSHQDVAELHALIAETEDIEVLHSTPEAYFADLRRLHQGPDGKLDLPRHEHDINPWGVGCYTSQVRVKQSHRALENALYAVEKMASTAALQGLMSYPRADLEAAQRDLLFAEFHDILPGSSIQPVEEMSLRVLDHGLEALSRLRARTFFALAQGQPRAAQGEIPILVYNPHPYPVRTTIACELQLADANWEDVYTQVQVMNAGVPLPTQVEKELSNLSLDWRKRVIFEAELAPSQMNRFDCQLETLPKKPQVSLVEEDGAFHFETERLDVVINAETGLVDRYEVDGVSYLAPNAFAALVLADNEDPWGSLIRGFQDVVGKFELMTPAESAVFSGVRADALPPVRVIEDGDVRTVVEAAFSYRRSALCVRYLLPKHGTDLEVDLRALWNEKDKMLKLSVPTTLSQARYLGQVAYGVGELPSNGDEAVAQKWVAIVDEVSDRALTCIDDGIYGSDFVSGSSPSDTERAVSSQQEGELRLSLLRSPAYAGLPVYERAIVPQDRATPRMDQGERRFHFWFNAGPIQTRLAAVDREALVRNERPFALSFFPHGEGTPVSPGIVLEDTVVQMTAFKQAEDGRGYILRLYEPSGQPRITTVRVPLLDLSEEVALTAFEVKTLYLDADVGTITETDLMEA
ncbi:MAG: glycoside hydrolase family 38 C-terminal domain-containing protein [Anaerolineae bacterium]